MTDAWRYFINRPKLYNITQGIESDHLLFEFAIDWSDRGTLIEIIMNALRGKMLEDGTASLYEG